MCSPPTQDEQRHAGGEAAGWTPLEAGTKRESVLGGSWWLRSWSRVTKNQGKCDPNEGDAFVMRRLWDRWARSRRLW